MHQGNAEIDKRNWDVEIYDPHGIEFMLMTHAHMDHSGLLPRLVQKGFHGKVYMTPPTEDLLRIMLLDSAHIQEMEAQWKSRKRLRHGDADDVIPLYTQKDAMATFPLFSTVTYGETFSPFPGLTVTFRDAGHILGAAMVELAVTEDGQDEPGRLLRRHRPAGAAPDAGSDGDRRGRFPLHGVDLREPEPQGRDRTA